VRTSDPLLLQAAYHMGNRHVGDWQLAEGQLAKLLQDSVSREPAAQRGLVVPRGSPAPFQPESGA